MVVTTLGYLEYENSYLMLHRTKKENDINHDKWIGIGGKLEEGETVLRCIQRECQEETGLIWNDPTLRGIITFNYREKADGPLFSELMFLFTGRSFIGKIHECDEGHLEWVSKDHLPHLPLWKGDRIFFYFLAHNTPLFYMQLDYLKDKLLYASINGKVLDPNDPRWNH